MYQFRYFNVSISNARGWTAKHVRYLVHGNFDISIYRTFDIRYRNVRYDIQHYCRNISCRTRREVLNLFRRVLLPSLLPIADFFLSNFFLLTFSAVFLSLFCFVLFVGFLSCGRRTSVAVDPERRPQGQGAVDSAGLLRGS